MSHGSSGTPDDNSSDGQSQRRRDCQAGARTGELSMQQRVGELLPVPHHTTHLQTVEESMAGEVLF
jgi:hypothetical protein